METILFDGLTPQKYIWVSPTGSDAGAGSKDSPLKTIQAAVNKATAGTAIMVKAGVYNENVKLPSEALGTPENPIWLISVDGPQAAKIVAVDQTLSTIYGYGTDNYVVQGFEIQGGFRGIQFSQSGRDFTNLVEQRSRYRQRHPRHEGRWDQDRSGRQRLCHRQYGLTTS